MEAMQVFDLTRQAPEAATLKIAELVTVFGQEEQGRLVGSVGGQFKGVRSGSNRGTQRVGKGADVLLLANDARSLSR